MTKKNTFLLFTDIDGTLLNNQKKISELNFFALKNSNNIIRVAISGRNLTSAKRVLPPSVPLDYLIFANGAGLLDWKKDKIIFSQNMDEQITRKVAQFLIKKQITFTVHRPIPQTHYYIYHIGAYIPEDLPMRNNYYKQFIAPLRSIEQIGDSTCIICMLQQKQKQFETLKNSLQIFGNEISLTRTTSPFTHKNIWLEIYHPQVNKGKTAHRLCLMLNIDPNNTIGIGNDYNDLSLLEFVRYPFVVENAPEELKKRFPVTTHNDNHAIARVLEKFSE